MAESTDKHLAVLLFTDIVDSVALQRRLGTQAYTRYITRHDELFKTCLGHVRGARILNETGDGFLVKFRSASDAVETALRLQCLLREEVCEGESMGLRIGIHMGEVAEMQEQITGETRAVGMAINLCARLMDLAEAGQILLTRAVFDDARQYTREHPLLEGFEPESLPALQWPAHGRYLFKGTDEPMDIYEVGALGWAPLKPPPDSSKAKRAVAADEEATLGWRPGAGLPIPRHEKWVIVEKLGEGGFGEVWLAEHSETREQRVFKFCFDAERLRSFKRELTLFRLLRDALGRRDDIAALYDVSVESPPFYLESQYVPTGNIAQWAKAQGGINEVPLQVRLSLMARTARALAAAHSVGIIHKDIKPSNILIHEENGQPLPRIADFGIGTLADNANLHDHNITQLGFTDSIMESESSGGSSGTQLYMAPEYLVGAPPSVRGDIYSLGVMLFQLASGDLTKPVGTGWQRDIEDPLLREDILKCVDVEPAHRFEDATDLAHRLETLPERHAQQRRLDEEHASQERQKLLAERRRRYLTLGAVGLLGLLGMVGTLFRGLQEQRKLKDAAKIMAGQADYFLANEHLQQNDAGKAVAHLARALRSNPAHQEATRRLTATLAHQVFPRRLYPSVGASSLLPDSTEPEKPISEQAKVDPTANRDSLAESGDFSNDGRYYANLTDEGGYTFWDCASGSFLHDGPLRENRENPAVALRFSPDGSRLFVKRERSYEIVALANGSIIRTIDLDEDRFGRQHELSRDGRYWIADHFIEPLLHVDEVFGEKRHLIPNVKGSGNAIVYSASSDGRYLVALWEESVGQEPAGYVSICDLQAETPAWSTIYQGVLWSRGPRPAISIDPANRYLAFGNRSGGIRLHQLDSGEWLRTFPGKKDYVFTLSFSPNGQHLAAGYFSQIARVWNVESGEPMSTPMKHKGAVVDLAFSSDGIRLLTASLDFRLRLWDPTTARILAQPMRHSSHVLAVKFDQSGKRALGVTLKGLGDVWDIGRLPAFGTPLDDRGQLLGLSEDATLACFYGEGRLSLEGFTDRKVRFSFAVEDVPHLCQLKGNYLILGWSHQGGSILQKFTLDGQMESIEIPHEENDALRFRFYDFDPINNRFLGVYALRQEGLPSQSTCEVRDFSNPLLTLYSLPHARTLREMAFSHDGRYVTTHIERQAFVWDLEASQPTPQELGLTFVPSAHAVATDAAEVLLGSVTGALQLFSLNDQQPLSEVLLHPGPVALVDLDDSGTTALTVSLPFADELGTAQLRAWNLTDSSPITPPIPVAVPPELTFATLADVGVGFLEFTPDGSQAVLNLGPGYSTLIDLHPSPRPTAPPSISTLAEHLADFRIDPSTGQAFFIDLDPKRSPNLPSQGTNAADWNAWFAWLQETGEQRPISPTSSWTSDRYLKYLLDRNDGTSFKRALTLSPNHPQALAKLAQATLGLESSPGRDALAAFYVKHAIAKTEPVPTGGELVHQRMLKQETGAPAEGAAPSLPHHHETYCVASDVCLELGRRASRAGNLQEARHHFRGALRAAGIAYDGDPFDSEIMSQLAESLRLQTALADAPADPARREAYLDAAFMMVSLLSSTNPRNNSWKEWLGQIAHERWSEPDQEALLQTLDVVAVERVANVLGDDLPSTWKQRWTFYYADIADATHSLAQEPASFYQRALVQLSLDHTQNALKALQAVIRLETNLETQPWTSVADTLVSRLLGQENG